MIQIRNVPEEVHRRLKMRAAQAGQSLSDYLLREVTESARLPTNAEMLERLRTLPVPQSDVDTAELIRDERARRMTTIAG